MASDRNTCDLLVIGGGPAGAVAARTLALAGLRVVMADSVKPAQPKVGESLPGGALSLLRSQGLLPWVERSRPARSVGNLSSWGDAGVTATDFIRDPHGMGWHVDRAGFDQGLRDAAADAGVCVRAAHVRHVGACPGGWNIRLADGALHAAWLVDAGGRSGVAGRWLNSPRLHDEPMAALYAWGRDDSQDQRSLVEAVPEGWWYTAGLPDGRRVASLHVEPALAARILRNGGEWQRRLQNTLHVRQEFRADASCSRPRGADAGGSWTPRPYGRNWLAVGDAALAMDPLSSQGIFNALYTGLRGAQALAQTLSASGAIWNAIKGPRHDQTSLPGERAGETPLAAYADRLAAIRCAYRRHAIEYYLVEQRWRAQPFWRNHHGAALHLAA